MKKNDIKLKSFGFTLVETLLVLAVSISMMALKCKEIQNDFEYDQAKIAGEQISQLGSAVNSYIVMNYQNLSQLKSDPSKGVSCDKDGCSISYKTLIDAKLLPASYSGLNVFRSGYNIELKRAGVAPNYMINGLITTNKTWGAGKNIRFDLLGRAMIAAGSDSGVEKQKSIISGYSGVWKETSASYSNIDHVGQLAYRVGYNSNIYSVYLRRDGTLPMTGDLNMGNKSIYQIANITANGEIKTTGAISGTNITGVNLSASNNIYAANDLSSKNIYAQNNISSQNIYAKNNISASNEIYAKKNISTDQDVFAKNKISSSNMYASNNITSNSMTTNYLKSNGNIDSAATISGNSINANYIGSNGRVGVGEYLQLNGVAYEGQGCSPNGLVGRNATGQTLSCQSGIWKTNGGLTDFNTGKPGSTCAPHTYCNRDSGMAMCINNREVLVSEVYWISSPPTYRTRKGQPAYKTFCDGLVWIN